MTESNVRCPYCSADIPLEVLFTLSTIMLKAFREPQRKSKNIGIDNDCQVCHKPITYVFEDPQHFHVFTADQVAEMGLTLTDIHPKPSENR